LLFPFIVLQYAAAARVAAAASSNLNQRKGDPIMSTHFNIANTLESFSFRSLGQSLANFHKDEEGNETVQTILLIFVAATILIGLSKIFMPDVTKKVTSQVKDLFGVGFFK
jgi:hypothetical protein